MSTTDMDKDSQSFIKGVIIAVAAGATLWVAFIGALLYFHY